MLLALLQRMKRIKYFLYFQLYFYRYFRTQSVFVLIGSGAGQAESSLHKKLLAGKVQVLLKVRDPEILLQQQRMEVIVISRLL